eukprot:scaffold2033_cov367-Prasinococcus_capsulatus_cf.AAC.3
MFPLSTATCIASCCVAPSCPPTAPLCTRAHWAMVWRGIWTTSAGDSMPPPLAMLADPNHDAGDDT